MRVVPDIIGFLCHECVENKETEHKIKTNAFLRPKCSTVASIVIFMEVIDHTFCGLMGATKPLRTLG